MITRLTANDLAASPTLLTALTALNNDHAIELSWASEERMAALISQAFLASRAGVSDALLITFDQDADYDSANFLWFKARYPRFVYVDRVVTTAAARGRGLAAALYHELFQAARLAGHDCIVCEVNSDPPNPASDAFHAKLGFKPVGEARLESGKIVRYLCCNL